MKSSDKEYVTICITTKRRVHVLMCLHRSVDNLEEDWSLWGTQHGLWAGEGRKFGKEKGVYFLSLFWFWVSALPKCYLFIVKYIKSACIFLFTHCTADGCFQPLAIRDRAVTNILTCSLVLMGAYFSRVSVLKCFGLWTPLYSKKLLRVPKNFWLCRLILWYLSF